MRDIDEEVETMSLGGSELYPVRVGGHIRWGDYYEDSVEGLVEISRYSGLGCFVGKMVTRRGLIYRK
jgi:hypothetical protein